MISVKVLVLCKKYLLEYKGTLTVFITLILASTAISIVSPFIIGNFLDNLIEGEGVNGIMRFAALFGGLNLLRILKNYITSIIQIKMHTQMSYNLIRDAIEHIQNLPLSYTNNQDSAYLSKRVGDDANSLIGFSIRTTQSILVNAAMLVVPFAVLLYMNHFVAMFMIGFLVVYITLYFIFKKPLYNAGFAFMESQDKFFSRLLEQLKHIKLIKLNSVQKQMLKRADSSFADFKGTAIHKQKVNSLYSGLDGSISTFAQIALFVVGGIQVLTGNFTIGMFTVFTSYFKMMLGASKYFFGLGASYLQTLASYDRIGEIFMQKAESQGYRVLEGIGGIELRDVGFSYAVQGKNEPQESIAKFNQVGIKRVISNYNAKFTTGRIYAISGVNGTGKSTLISLIAGMYVDEFSGTITYNGIDIRSIDMVKTRKDFLGYADQESVLISDSIGYNLEFDYVGASEEKEHALRGCMEILNMEDFITERTLGFEINDKNTNMSVGERQKISVLKVLYKNPLVMIFDEPTSALDTDTTYKFIEHLKKIKRDRIIIIITHDEYIKGQCDEVVELS